MGFTVAAVFILVYVGMMLGRLPWLALDRTGVALLGAIVLIVSEAVTPETAWYSVDMPTMGLLFGLMVVSSQLRLGGFYTLVARSIASANVSPPMLLGLLIGVAAVLSALLCNDIVCLAIAPILVEGCAHRKLNPVPFLLALACASNIGSAATLIGNPQNMLIGQKLGLPFAGYLVDALPPVVVSLVLLWLYLAWSARRSWAGEQRDLHVQAPTYHQWQTIKGLLVLAALILGFVFSNAPREVLALAAAGILLTSRRMATRRILAFVDWHLLVLFAGLFVVNHAFSAAGHLEVVLANLKHVGVALDKPAWLFGGTVLLSNLVSNVPATMLLLPSATHPLAGPILALASTFAGNLFLVGSIANLIVVDRARNYGVKISWLDHAKVGVPVALASLGAAAIWLAVRAG